MAKSSMSTAHLDKRMHRLKRYYVGPFFGANAAASAVAACCAARAPRGRRAAWTAAALTHLAVVAHAPRGWPHRDSGPASMIGVATIGTATAASLSGGTGATWSAAVAALGGAATYIGWYASYGRAPSPALVVGQRLPELLLRRPDGSPFSSTQLAGRPAAIFFTRGNWCPFCTAQIHQLVADYATLSARNVQVVVVCAQPDEESQKLADRFDVDIIWAVDPGLSAATELGITDPGGVPMGIPPTYGPDTVMPTLVVVDADHSVIGSEQTDNFRLRPDASSVLAILDAAGTTGRCGSTTLAGAHS